MKQKLQHIEILGVLANNNVPAGQGFANSTRCAYPRDEQNRQPIVVYF